jgi:hypothetical protein
MHQGGHTDCSTIQARDCSSTTLIKDMDHLELFLPMSWNSCVNQQMISVVFLSA